MSDVQNPDSCDGVSSQQQDVNQPQSQAAKKRVSVPPIIIDNPTNSTLLIKSINDITESIVEGKMIEKDRVKVSPSSADAHRKIQIEISEQKLKSHTFETEDQNELKVVILGLLSGYPVEEILKGFKFQPIQ
ncbi:hypothetical protein AVEN_78494-1 [Araneus ventricosus]|uniref:Uncharacterized protein n=1 Tax=Araneus ventricosus TaxID=182803 RepID=A0A4Y2EP28_ARAVE|nr:hypothetical protein AVEN_78494-1 [Araneus ventricosus]